MSVLYKIVDLFEFAFKLLYLFYVCKLHVNLNGGKSRKDL